MRMAVVCLLLIAGSDLRAQDDLWQYTHPRAQALVGIEWRRTANSYFAGLVRQNLQEFAALEKAVPGADLLDQIDRVLISSPGKRSPKSKEEPPVVLAVQGRFDAARVKRSLARGFVAGQYQGLEVLSAPKARGSDMEMAFVRTDLLLLGDRASLRSVIDRSRSLASPPPPLVERAKSVAAHNDVWAVLALPPEAFAGESLPQAAMFKEIRGLDFGVSFQDGMDFQLYLATPSPESAQAMSNTVSSLLQLAALQKPNDPETQKFMRKLRVATESESVHLAFSLDRAEVADGFRQARAAFQQRTGPVNLQAAMKSSAPIRLENLASPRPSAPAAAAPATPPGPPKPLVVRISGMEDGPREITLPGGENR
ncbi:MAG TPA: hypothetical protein DEH78_19350 [Solibacterales bacterium]|nr:hypothetical protein [Bryobacterales bacterium]